MTPWKVGQGSFDAVAFSSVIEVPKSFHLEYFASRWRDGKSLGWSGGNVHSRGLGDVRHSVGTFADV